jgi:SAM-dependent methyltransferase
MTAVLAPADACWICGGRRFTRYHEIRLDFQPYAEQDPELAAYTDTRVWLRRCDACGFGQPEALPTLPDFFERMYDQRWSEEWVEQEFDADYKDLIFRTILRELARRRPAKGALLDIGAHAGRFMSLAQAQGWRVEGVELNPRTAACAARRTGAPVHRIDARVLATEGRRYSAVCLTDVLEHIPEPLDVLSTVAALLDDGGCVAIKVPCGDNQWRKERVLAALRPGRKVSLADNLVHVNHFSAASLRAALERTGFTDVAVRTAAPELFPASAGSRAVRLAIYAAGRIPGAVHTPVALNLQAYATRSAR